MRLFFLFGVWCAGVVGVQAQTAQEVVEKTAKTYADLKSYQVQAVTRSARLMPMSSFYGSPGQRQQQHAQATEPAGYSLSSGGYKQFTLKLRKPDDWSLAVQTYRTSAPVRSISAQGTRVVTPGAPILTFESLARWENQAPEFGKQNDGRFDQKGVAANFLMNLKTLLSSNGVNELVLAQFEPKIGGFDTARTFAVTNPEFVEDGVKNHAMHVIRGKTSTGYDVVVWIDKVNFLVDRVLIYRRESYPGPMGPTGTSDAQAAARTMVLIDEAVYRAQLVNPLFQRADFALQTPSMTTPLTPTTQEWLPQPVMLELIGGLKRPTQNTENATTAEATKPAVTAPAAPVVIEGQALTHEQMSGIVLIEGDGGTATGFMTKIRDVDFVVTNLHVLGGNKKMSMKTLGGEEIPMLGVFGAAGSDIAIIRIENGKGDLKMAGDVFKTSKIGDKVVVVGNRQGGGVATQTAGSILGVGPTRVEVNANFEPGNSGSPIVNLSTGEVVGVASYSETRRIDVDEGGGSTSRNGAGATPPKVEKRWFGYRLDSVTKWEAIDLAKWNAQENRINAFREMSEALVAVLRLEFGKARRHPRLSTIINSFESRVNAASNNQIVAATEVKDLFRVIRTIADDGVRDLTSGDYYDYYRTSLYWETSIPAQLEYRKAIVEVLKKYESNSSGYLSRMRDGN